MTPKNTTATEDECISQCDSFGGPASDCADIVRRLDQEIERLLSELEDTRQERDNLSAWKEEALQTEELWDPRRVGELIGVPYGASVREAIEPAIRALLAEVERLSKTPCTNRPKPGPYYVPRTHRPCSHGTPPGIPCPQCATELARQIAQKDAPK